MLICPTGVFESVDKVILANQVWRKREEKQLKREENVNFWQGLLHAIAKVAQDRLISYNCFQKPRLLRLLDNLLNKSKLVLNRLC